MWAAYLIALLIGLGYGLLAGWVGGRVDGWLMRIVDVVYALPDVLVIVLLIEVLQGTLAAVPDIARRVAALVVALGFVGWVGIARLVRAFTDAASEAVASGGTRR